MLGAGKEGLSYDTNLEFFGGLVEEENARKHFCMILGVFLHIGARALHWVLPKTTAPIIVKLYVLESCGIV